MGYVTSMKWFDENVLALSTSSGALLMNDIREKTGTGDTSKCKKCTKLWTVDGAAIWDVALWRDQSGVKLITADDSGAVSLIDPRMDSVQA